MRTFATFGLGSLGSIRFQHAIEALPADRPHGVASDCWIRLDESLASSSSPHSRPPASPATSW